MKDRDIPNFVGLWPLTVVGSCSTCGPLVSIKQYAGANHFQHSMTPEQAIDMANALLEAAAYLTPTKEAAHAE